MLSPSDEIEGHLETKVASNSKINFVRVMLEKSLRGKKMCIER